MLILTERSKSTLTITVLGHSKFFSQNCRDPKFVSQICRDSYQKKILKKISFVTNKHHYETYPFTPSEIYLNLQNTKEEVLI